MKPICHSTSDSRRSSIINRSVLLILLAFTAILLSGCCDQRVVMHENISIIRGESTAVVKYNNQVSLEVQYDAKGFAKVTDDEGHGYEIHAMISKDGKCDTVDVIHK